MKIRRYDQLEGAYDLPEFFYDQAFPGVATNHKMKKVRINNLGRANPDLSAQIAEAIILAMTGNPNFGTPNPPLASLTTKTNAVKNKSNAIRNLEIELATLRVQLKDAVVDLKTGLNSLAGYVQEEAEGNLEMITSAGMTVAGVRTPVGPMTQVLSLKVSVTDSEGVLTAEWVPVFGCFVYLVETATDPAGPWTQHTASSKARTELTGLTPGTKYWVRVRAFGAAGFGPYSDPACRIAA